MKNIWKLLLICILSMGLMVTAIGCGGQAGSGDDDIPTLIVGSETTYPPFEFVDENGEYAGFDMDLIRAIGEEMGFNVQIASLEFKSLVPAVQQGQVDLAIAAISFDEERQKAVDYSDPYFDAGLIVAVKADDNEIKSVDDLKGKVIGAEVGTIGADAANDVKALDPTTQVRIYDSIGVAFMELQRGGIDAVINDFLVTEEYIRITGDAKIKMVGEVFSADDQYGIIVRKGNTELLNTINEGLRRVKENGTYDAIYEKWFGDRE